MAEHQLCVVTTGSRHVPVRICSLLAQRNIDVNDVHISRTPDQAHWWIQLRVTLPDGEAIGLVVKRLNRLVDVLKTVDLTDEVVRRSLFVKLNPPADALTHVAHLARIYGAEIVEMSTVATILHVSDTPKRCDQLLALLTPWRVVEVIPGSTSAVSGGARVLLRGESVTPLTAPSSREPAWAMTPGGW